MAATDSFNIAASAAIPAIPIQQSYASVAAKMTMEQLQNFVTPFAEKSAASAAAPMDNDSTPVQTVVADTRVITQSPSISPNLSVGAMPTFSRFSEEDRIMLKIFGSMLPAYNSNGYMSYFDGDIGPKCENCDEFRAAKFAVKAFDDGRFMSEDMIACIVRNARGNTHLERYHVRAAADIRRVFCSMAFATIIDLELRLNQKLNKSDVDTVRQTLLAAMEKQKMEFQAQLDEKTAALRETQNKTTDMGKGARRQIELMRKQIDSDNAKMVSYLEQITLLTEQNAKLALGSQNGQVSEKTANEFLEKVRAENKITMKTQLKEKSEKHAKELRAQADAHAEACAKMQDQIRGCEAHYAHVIDQMNVQAGLSFQTMQAEIAELRAKLATQQTTLPALRSIEDAGLEADPATYVAGFCTHVFDSETGPARCVNPLAYKNPKYCACHVIELRKLASN